MEYDYAYNSLHHWLSLIQWYVRQSVLCQQCFIYKCSIFFFSRHSIVHNWKLFCILVICSCSRWVSGEISQMQDLLTVSVRADMSVIPFGCKTFQSLYTIWWFCFISYMKAVQKVIWQVYVQPSHSSFKTFNFSFIVLTYISDNGNLSLRPFFSFDTVSNPSCRDDVVNVCCCSCHFHLKCYSTVCKTIFTFPVFFLVPAFAGVRELAALLFQCGTIMIWGNTLLSFSKRPLNF
jgi:hypothetical protein